MPTQKKIKSDLSTRFLLIPKYFISDIHPITVAVVGCGGTGSHVLANLAMMNETLIQMGTKGIYAWGIDGDYVEAHNISRQMFLPSEIGMNKATAIITRINRAYGFCWNARNSYLTNHNDIGSANIIISCVDTVKSRKAVSNMKKSSADMYKNYLWIDVGNTNTGGQIILSAKDMNVETKNIFEIFGDIKEDESTPSCSMYESILSQGLFLNKFMALHTVNMLWELFFYKRIDYSAIFLNYETMQINKSLFIKTNTK